MIHVITEFKPFVEYSKDSLRVETEDCSMRECYINDNLTLLYGNQHGELVGVIINGIKNLIK